MSTRMADIKDVLRKISRPQMSMWVKPEVLAALEVLIDDFQVELLLETIHGDYLFSKKIQIHFKISRFQKVYPLRVFENRLI